MEDKRCGGFTSKWRWKSSYQILVDFRGTYLANRPIPLYECLTIRSKLGARTSNSAFFVNLTSEA
jgi:hypothetical protein